MTCSGRSIGGLRTHDCAKREPITSAPTVTRDLRNSLPHSGSWWFHGQDGITGSIPRGLHHKPAAQTGYDARPVARPSAGNRCLPENCQTDWTVVTTAVGACPGRHPLVATGGIGTGAAIAAVLVAPRRQALTPWRMNQAPAPSRTIRQTGPRCRAGLVPEGVLLALRRELDAFREGNYVPIINEHC
jgi:hypothetical protein